MRAEAARDDYFDAPPEQALQLLDQRQVVAESTVLRQIDQQVDVAVRALVARIGEPNRRRLVAPYLAAIARTVSL